MSPPTQLCIPLSQYSAYPWLQTYTDYSFFISSSDLSLVPPSYLKGGIKYLRFDLSLYFLTKFFFLAYLFIQAKDSGDVPLWELKLPPQLVN